MPVNQTAPDFQLVFEELKKLVEPYAGRVLKPHALNLDDARIVMNDHTGRLRVKDVAGHPVATGALISGLIDMLPSDFGPFPESLCRLPLVGAVTCFCRGRREQRLHVW